MGIRSGKAKHCDRFQRVLTSAMHVQVVSTLHRFRVFFFSKKYCRLFLYPESVHPGRGERTVAQRKSAIQADCFSEAEIFWQSVRK